MDRKPRLLIVEDDEAIRSMVADVLIDDGYEVRTASEGGEGLSILAQWRPDLVVLDLMMRGVDGWEFRRRQQAQPEVSRVPVLLVSASRRDELPQVAKELDAAGFLPKPFDLDTLLAAIEARLA
jgi:DNA-binding response OmpR family regulator